MLIMFYFYILFIYTTKTVRLSTLQTIPELYPYWEFYIQFINFKEQVGLSWKNIYTYANTYLMFGSPGVWMNNNKIYFCVHGFTFGYSNTLCPLFGSVIKVGELITLKARVEKDVGVTIELNGGVCTMAFSQLPGMVERKIQRNMEVKADDHLVIRKLYLKRF